MFDRFARFDLISQLLIMKCWNR